MFIINKLDLWKINKNWTEHKKMPTGGRDMLVNDDWRIVVNDSSVDLRPESYVVVHWFFFWQFRQERHSVNMNVGGAAEW